MLGGGAETIQTGGRGRGVLLRDEGAAQPRRQRREGGWRRVSRAPAGLHLGASPTLSSRLQLVSGLLAARLPGVVVPSTERI